jgi:hypothetical protein
LTVRRAARWAPLVVVAATLLVAAPASAQTIIRVEEDWRLVIGVPDPAVEAPQITTTISPRGNIDGVHCIFELNHGTLGDYAPGGLQLQRWVGDQNTTVRNFPKYQLLAIPDEVIVWTMKMSHNGGNTLTFDIDDGYSTTWGAFGNQGYLLFEASTSLSDLNQYDPAVSVANSLVGYASHRVKDLCITEVRYYTASGLHYRDTTHRCVHDYDPNADE